MAWLVGIVVGALIIMGLITSPGFRTLFVGLLILGGLALWAIIENDNKRLERYRAEQAAEARAETARWQKVAISAIELRDITVSPLYKGSTTYKLAGAAKNNAPETITELTFAITAYDCPPNATSFFSQCEVVGRGLSNAAMVIPPGEVRAIEGSFQLPPLPTPRGQIQLAYSLTSVRAQ